MPIYCEICKKEFFFITPKHLKTHQLTTKEYKILYPSAVLSSNERKLKISTGLIGHKSWNKGLTKETHTSLLKSSISHIGQVPWHTGHIKKTGERVLKMSKSIQKSVKAYFNSGGKSWLSGLTKETDERVIRVMNNLNKNNHTKVQNEKCSIGVKNAWKRGDFF